MRKILLIRNCEGLKLMFYLSGMKAKLWAKKNQQKLVFKFNIKN